MTQPLTGPLVGQHILVTRPAGQAANLVAGIEQLGGHATHIPFLAIHPSPDLRDLEKIADHLAEYEACIFVSANAVHMAWPTLTRRHAWPEALAAGVVGPGSARALGALGVGRVLQPEVHFDSEGLLALPQFAPAHCQGKAFALIRGEGGRDLIAATLRERGAQVDEAATYVRSLDSGAVSRVAQLMHAQSHEQPSAIIVTSSESLKRFMNATPLDLARDIASVRIIAPHVRIAEVARGLGFNKVTVCPGGDEGILRFLQTYNESSLTDAPGMEAL